MASIRNLKKSINYLTYELLNEAFLYKYLHKGVNEEEFDQIIQDLVKMRNELISRINTKEKFENSSEIKTHFSRIRTDMVNLIKVVERLSLPS